MANPNNNSFELWDNPNQPTSWTVFDNPLSKVWEETNPLYVIDGFKCCKFQIVVGDFIQLISSNFVLAAEFKFWYYRPLTTLSGGIYLEIRRTDNNNLLFSKSYGMSSLLPNIKFFKVINTSSQFGVNCYVSFLISNYIGPPAPLVFYLDFITSTGLVSHEEIYDVDNDFRMKELLPDIDNDFRMKGWVSHNDIDNDFRAFIEIKKDMDNDFRTKKLVLKDIDNKVNSVIEVKKDVSNIIHTAYLTELKNINNDIRIRKLTLYNINNDFRMMSSWQIPQAGEVGFQSAGKTEVKVYINSVEQTDVNVDSISINQVLNVPTTASFDLGRPYDDSKPNMDDEVQIKYNNILLFQGYVIEINPTDNPEHIKINCQDEYWNLNKTKKYCFVGHKPADTNEYYFPTIKEALTDFGFVYNIGNFIPQTMDLYGTGIADGISTLIQKCGNYGFFLSPDKTKKLWQGGNGSIINLEKQVIETNLGLYQVIRHSFRENITGIINKFRVLLGNWTVKKTAQDSETGLGTKTYNYTYYTSHVAWVSPVWNTGLEKLAKNSATGYGYDYQNPNIDYKDVFRKFWLPALDPKVGEWTDKYPPVIKVGGHWEGGVWTEDEYIRDGFSINYEIHDDWEIPFGARTYYPSITFSEPMVDYILNSSGEVINTSRKVINLFLWKEHKVSYTINKETNPDTEPIEDISNPMMFYTSQMGTYPDTMMEILHLSNLSKQEGYIVKDNNGIIIEIVPSWDDTEFAKDYANWELSKVCDKKITGSIDLTIDAMIYYNIDLSKRIKIEGIVDPINIISITYNFNSFIATLNVESYRAYQRTKSLASHGE